MCLRSNPLHKVLERLANPGVRRLIVVEVGSKRAEGIITIADIFKFLLELPHLGGPLTTNKVAALAKFLERKLQEPNGLASMKPELVELAVKNAKDTITASQIHDL
ncbi:unnamed protein product [Camellia sinensis]